MKQLKTALILAGGKGTRFSEYTKLIPKPMIRINKIPLLIHIINIYKKQGVNNFIVLTGYKSEVITDFFSMNFPKIDDENFIINKKVKVRLLFTGLESQTGGRVKQAIDYFDDEYFYLTYGDGVGNINLNKLNQFHFENETIGTLTAVRPPARFGSLDIDENNKVKKFGEKNNLNEGWINGGFFILNKSIKRFIKDDSTALEREPLEKLALINELKAYKHFDYWRPVDTIREKEILEEEMDNNKFNFYEKLLEK